MSHDNIGWHLESVPDGAPEANAATHIGYFLQWAFCQGLAGEIHTVDCAEDLAAVVSGEVTGRDYLMDGCDGKFTVEDLNDVGNAFTEAYYGDYLLDYQALLGAEGDDVYAVACTPGNFAVISAHLDEKFAEWRSQTMDEAAKKATTPWWRFW